MSTPIALFAGEGHMPIRVFEELKREKKKVLLIAIDTITPKSLIDEADFVVKISLYQIGKAIKVCKKYGVRELVMVGRIHHSKIFSISLFKLDLTTLRLWLSLKDKRADTILKAIADLLAKMGISLISSIKYLMRFVPKEGILTKKKPSKSQWDDIFFGAKLAKDLGRLDIGQTVVVKKMSVVAVEAMEGTDGCIERAGQLAGSSLVVVKMSKPKQDMRFDVPVIGLNTIQKLIKIKASVLAVESEKSVILDPKALELANENDLIIVALPCED
jgi:DUF1009 family protein